MKTEAAIADENQVAGIASPTLCDVLDRVLTKGVVVDGDITIAVADIERLGMTLMRQAEEIENLRREFGLEDSDLNMDLGPLGKLF